jgi:hypothetical protein
MDCATAVRSGIVATSTAGIISAVVTMLPGRIGIIIAGTPADEQAI